jgi:hypothetical protein
MGAPAITFLVSAFGYALMLCAAPYWLDSSELAAASFELGLAHAPGQPLAMLLGKLCAFFPLGDVSLRVGLGQLFCGAGAAAMVAWLGRRVARAFTDDARIAEALGVMSGLLYAGSYAAAFQAIRPEVYALSALLVLSAIALCVRYADGGDAHLLGLAGLCFGLGLSNHHYLTVLGAVPPALALLPARGDARLRRGLLLGVGGTLLGLVPYTYLPLRAAHDPVVEWGHPTTLPAFWWVVSARSFQKSAGAVDPNDLPALLGALLDQLTPVAPLIALAGAYLLMRRQLRLGAALLLALLGPINARLLVPFDAGNPDAFGYLSTGIAALALLCVPLPAALLAALPVRTRTPAAVTLAAAALVLGLVRAPAHSLAGFDGMRAVFEPVLRDAPAEAIMVPAYYETTFSLEYLRVVEGQRPDLSYLPRHFLDQPGLPAALVRRDPRLQPLLRDGALAVDALLGAGRPLLVEYDVDLDRRLLALAGAVAVPAGLADPGSRRFALWQAYLRVHQLCRLGAEPPRLAGAVSALRERAGPAGSAEIDALLAACAGMHGR